MTVAQALDQLLPNASLSAESNSVGMGGLRSADGRAFPLRRVTVRTSVAGACARTVIEQQFTNPYAEALDVTWIFPLPSDGALVELQLRAGDVVVVGECQTRENASAHFEQARSQGQRAALVEIEQRGVHTLSLAGLPPRSDVTVQLTVVELLPVVDAHFRWQFPTTIAPRYTPGNEWGHSGFGTTPDTDVVPNASRLTPPLRLTGGTILDLEVEIAGPLSSLESSLHAVKLSLDSGIVRVAPSAITTLNRDFILEFSTAESSQSVSRAYSDGLYTVAIVEPPADVNTRALPRDAVFVVDISGSMEGAKLDAAKLALTGALHGLQRNDRFKLLAFDDRVERFRDDFLEYNDTNLRSADEWIARLHSRGGTEMLAAIQDSLAGDTDIGRVRTVLFITDGQSNEERRLLPAVANRRGNAAFFTLGIDTAVNASLLKLLAKAGGGACELCTPSDDIDAVVAKLETRFGTPILSDLRVDGAARPTGEMVFSGRPATVFIEGAPPTVHIRATSPAGEFSVSVVPQRIQFSLGALWARERVSFLEERLTMRPFEEEAIKPEIVRIALAHQIASTFTSFVCIDRSVRLHGARRHVVQPVELPESWEGVLSSAGGNVQQCYSAIAAMRAAMREMPLMSPLPGGARGRSSNSSADDVLASALPELEAREGGFVREVVGKLIPSRRAPAKASEACANHKKAAVQAEACLKRDDFAGTLARTQAANGSFGNDVSRSAAALLVLILLGSTRLKGDRRRTVKKIADWLGTQHADSRAILALKLLSDAERSPTPVADADWRSFIAATSEGTMLKALL